MVGMEVGVVSEHTSARAQPPVQGRKASLRQLFTQSVSTAECHLYTSMCYPQLEVSLCPQRSIVQWTGELHTNKKRHQTHGHRGHTEGEEEPSLRG